MKQKAYNKSDMTGSNQITEGVIWKQLLLFFFPILFGTFFQQLYNTTDAIIVGRFVGKEALAAVGGPTGTLINLLLGFFIGISSGNSVVVAQFYGLKKHDSVKQAVHTSAAFVLISGVFLMIAGILLTPMALTLMNTPADIFDYSVTFMRIYFLGIIPNLIYNMGAGILRATGDSKRPLYFLILSCFTNIIFDLIFVVLLNMEVAGAACATVLSQFLSATLILRALQSTNQSYQLHLKEIKIHKDMLKRIIRIGFPAGLQSIMYSSSNLIIQSSINTLDTDTLAAWTAYCKIDSLFWMIISAFGISITTFVGQNYGAGKKDRVYQGIGICMIMSFAATIFLSLLLYWQGSNIYLLFTSDPVVIAKGSEILRYLVPAFFTYVCIEIFSGSLRGAGDCWIPMLITCFGICALRVLWVWIQAPYTVDIFTIIISYPITWITTSILFFIYFTWFSKLKKFRIAL